MNESPQNFIQKIFGIGGHQETNPLPGTPPQPLNPAQRPTSNTPPDGNAPEPTPPAPQKKKNIFQKIFGGGGDKNKQPQPQPTQPPQQP